MTTVQELKIDLEKADNVLDVLENYAGEVGTEATACLLMGFLSGLTEGCMIANAITGKVAEFTVTDPKDGEVVH